MGVKGLWRLLDGTGRPLNLESLEGKVLAVDISVWLNMAIKGMRDYQGHAMANAHLTTLFNRICKLLYYGVKPVFVFDGQAPALKQRTLRERRERKQFHAKESRKASEKILQNYLKKQLLEEAIGKGSHDGNSGPSDSQEERAKSPGRSKVVNNKVQDKDIYDLPPMSSQLDDSYQDDLEEELKMRTELQNEYMDESGHLDMAGVLNMNIDSKNFASLPSDVQYELLKDLKEIRKRRRTRLEAMPEESNSFSDYQIAGLLAKRKISKKMESVENKMTEENLAASSVYAGFSSDIFKTHAVDARQIVSDSSSHYIWLRKLDDKKNRNDNKSENLENKKFLSTINEETANVEAQSNPPFDHINLISPTKTIDDVNKDINIEDDITNAIVKAQTNNPISNIGDEVQSNTVISNMISLKKSQPSQENLKTNDLDNAVVDVCEDVSDNVRALLPSREIINIDIQSRATSTTEQQTSSFVIKDVEYVDGNHENIIVPTDSVKVPEQAESTANDNNLIIEDIPECSTSVSKRVIESKNTKVSDVVVESSEDSDEEEFIDVSEAQEKLVHPVSDDTMVVSHDQRKINDDRDVSEDTIEHDISAPEVAEINPWEGLNADNIKTFAGQLDAESHELRDMMQAKERAARDLSQSAQLECQDLLKLFGLPYIISPQEAEAQCAALELLGLTNGTITEDSDIWLFGGKFVIKDMFGSKRDAIAFNAGDIEMQLGLNRDRFICVAMCSGSDYTTGLHGVGPVTALEILREFTGEGLDGLVKLRKWWNEICANAKQAIPVETKIKSQLRRINLKKDFPSQAVYKAYTQPIVDETNTKFEWGFPDLDELRNFAINTMGWTKLRVNEALIPVMKKLGQQRSSQSKMTQFLPVAFSQKNNKKKSKRVMRAVAVLTNKTGQSECPTAKKKPRRSAKTNKKVVNVEAKKEVKLNLSESSSEEG